MESRAKLLGHSIHQMLVVIPLGMFIGAVVFDGLYLWTGYSTLASAAYWNVVVGIAGGLLAAVFGLIDWLAIPAGTRAKRIGLLHGGSKVVVVGVFGLAWLMRSTAGDISGDIAPTAGIFLLEVARCCRRRLRVAWRRARGQARGRRGRRCTFERAELVVGLPASQPGGSQHRRVG